MARSLGDFIKEAQAQSLSKDIESRDTSPVYTAPSIDIFNEVRLARESIQNGQSSQSAIFVGGLYFLDHNTARLLTHEGFKNDAGGIEHTSLLLAYREDIRDGVDSSEIILLRVLDTTTLRDDSDSTNQATVLKFLRSNPERDFREQMDIGTLSNLSYSAYECSVKGMFYRENGTARFGGDIDSLQSPIHYKVFKPVGALLGAVASLDVVDDGTPKFELGRIRYTSTEKRPDQYQESKLMVNPLDFLGQRTALLGMTRTGKSNTVKIIISCIADRSYGPNPAEGLPAGQIIFDVNGEYANDNQQDAGTSIYSAYQGRVHRFSVEERPGFLSMRANFYEDIEDASSILYALLGEGERDSRPTYFSSFLSLEWPSEDELESDPNGDISHTTRLERRKAAFRSVLYRAGYEPPSSDYRVYFTGNRELEYSDIPGLKGVNPKHGLTMDQAVQWFTALWDKSGEHEFFEEYAANHGGRSFIDEELEAILVVLTRHRVPGGGLVSGYKALQKFRGYHTRVVGERFQNKIVDLVAQGNIVILDLSEGDMTTQRFFSDRASKAIFDAYMRKFKMNEKPNYVQIYIEEAHNLLTSQEPTNIYARIAKEGQKLRIGLSYSTQEGSSIPKPIRANTQNWFISGMNNNSEQGVIASYYDFREIVDTLSRSNEPGFVRVRTASSKFVNTVQTRLFDGT